MTSWTRDQVLLLINLYREHPCLYQVKNIEYKNRHARTRALETIKNDLRVKKIDVTIADIKSKFNNVRSNFLVEHRKAMKANHSGMGVEEVYQPNLYYYKNMQFILDHTAARKAKDTTLDEAQTLNNDDSETLHSAIKEEDGLEVSEPLESEFENSTEFEYEQPLRDDSRSIDSMNSNQQLNNHRTSCTATKANKRRFTDSDAVTSSLQAINSIARTICNESASDDIDAFCKFIGSKLRQIKNVEIVADAQEAITSITLKAYRRYINL